MRLLVVLVSAPALAQSTFHGNAARTGVYDGAGPAKSPAPKWTFKTEGPIVGSPAVKDGVVYVASLDTNLYAIDQATGKEKWKFKSRMPIASTPAIGDGVLYFVSSTGALAAIDTATGKPKWVFTAEHERKFEAKGLHGYPSAAQTIPDAWDIYTSSPLIAAGKVYFGSGDGNVYAVDQQTGLLQWKVATSDVVHTSPAFANGTVYVGSFDSALYAIDADSGQVRWTFQAGQDPAIHNQVGFQSSPAVADGVVYAGCRDGHLYAIDAATGKKKWDYPTNKSWVNGTPAVRDGVVYVGTSDSARFMAIDAKSGRLKFNYDAKAYIFSSAAVAGGLVYFGNHAGRVRALDAKTGALAWEFETDGAKADPLKVLAEDGSFSQGSFKPLFNDFEDMYMDFYRFASIGAVMSSPVVDHGVLFVSSMDGKLYALQ
jgi:outer membrane protein assembly factor BamB